MQIMYVNFKNEQEMRQYVGHMGCGFKYNIVAWPYSVTTHGYTIKFEK